MISIYYHDASYARDHGELDDYRYSNRENFNCRSVIEAAIKAHFDGCRLSKQALADVLKYYRRERVALVLAATVINKSYDGRFSPSNKAWAESVRLPDHALDGYSQLDNMTVCTHPAILDGFITAFRRHESAPVKLL